MFIVLAVKVKIHDKVQISTDYYVVLVIRFDNIIDFIVKRRRVNIGSIDVNKL